MTLVPMEQKKRVSNYWNFTLLYQFVYWYTANILIIGITAICCVSFMLVVFAVQITAIHCSQLYSLSWPAGLHFWILGQDFLYFFCSHSLKSFCKLRQRKYTSIILSQFTKSWENKWYKNPENLGPEYYWWKIHNPSDTYFNMQLLYCMVVERAPLIVF